MCGRVEKSAEEQNKYCDILHCKCTKALGLKIRKTGSASPARPGNSTDDKDKDEPGNVIPEESGANKVGSVNSMETLENQIVDNTPLDTEPSTTHATTKQPSGILCSTKPDISVVGYLKVSRTHSPRKQRVRFATTTQTSLVSDAATISLLLTVVALLNLCQDHSIHTSTAPHHLQWRLAVTDTGTTEHIIPERLAFISYRKFTKSRASLGNISYIQILGEGTSIISLTGKTVMVRNALYLLGDALSSLQPACSYKATRMWVSWQQETGGEVCVYLPNFCLKADTPWEYHISYTPPREERLSAEPRLRSAPPAQCSHT